jgi:1-deoxy-D-xylulose-5-phosphate reductoisomerase
VHSFVEFCDGSVLAQMGRPTMELPILYALTHPGRVPDTGLPPFDPVALGPLTFEPVRAESFPMLGLGVAAGRRGGAAPAVYNAANEEAVALFLEGRIGFAGIAAAVTGALEAHADRPGATLDDLLAADALARAHVRAHAPTSAGAPA